MIFLNALSTASALLFFNGPAPVARVAMSTATNVYVYPSSFGTKSKSACSTTDFLGTLNLVSLLGLARRGACFRSIHYQVVTSHGDPSCFVQMVEETESFLGWVLRMFFHLHNGGVKTPIGVLAIVV